MTFMGENKLKNKILSQLESNSMVTITDDLGRVEYANNVFCKTLEYDSDKVVGESHTLFKSHLHSDPLYKGLWRTLKMGKTWKGTLSETLSNGKEIWLDATIIPFKTKKEKHTRYLAIYNDVTQYKLDNKNLKEENIKSKTLFNNMPVYVFTITKHGKILNVSKKCYNKSIKDLIGTYIYDYINIDFFEVFKRNIDYVFINKTLSEFESYDLDANGKKINYSTLVSPNFNELGIVVSATLIIKQKLKKNIINEIEELRASTLQTPKEYSTQ